MARKAGRWRRGGDPGRYRRWHAGPGSAQAEAPLAIVRRLDLPLEVAEGRRLADARYPGPPGVLLPAAEARALRLPYLVRLCPAGPWGNPRAADGR
eukprot:7957387-Pyramimonas_sp.AAC.1